MVEEVRSELQHGFERGSEWQEHRGGGDKAAGRQCFENPASTLTCIIHTGSKGSLNDILQKSHTLHTLLNSPLVSGIKTIFTEGVIQCQLYRIKIRSCSCK